MENCAIYNVEFTNKPQLQKDVRIQTNVKFMTINVQKKI